MSDTDDDPFMGTHSDTDEDYLPDQGNHNLQEAGTSSDSDKENAEPPTNQTQHGKKRLVHKSSWKRNMQKMKRTKGESYVNTAGHQVHNLFAFLKTAIYLRLFIRLTKNVWVQTAAVI